MKRILSLLLTLFLSTGIIGGTLPVYAAESPLSEGYYQYEETDDGVRITKYTGNELEVVIPSTLGGKPVVTIGEDAFSYNFLNSVVIPEGVTTIEHNAFYSCKTLKTVDLPESLVTLNSYSFASCYINNIDSENWQDGILYVDDWVLRTDGCGLNPVVREGTKKIANRAFVYQHTLYGLKTESITLPNSLVYIDPEAFLNFRTEEFIMADGGTDYKCCGGVLYTADGKELVKYPVLNESLSYSILDFTERIRMYAFAGCQTLEGGITFPDSLKYIGDSAFEGVWYLPEAVLNGIVEIGSRAFHSSGIKSVSFGGSLKTVGDEAFYSVPLKTIDFPASVTYIGKGVLGSCLDLETITVDDSNRYYCDDGIALFDDGFERILQFPLALEAKSYTLPSQVRIIGGKAFEGCRLEDVVIPSGLQTIEYDAFKNCEYIREMSLPDGVTSIGDGAFCGCYALNSVDFGNSLVTIGVDAFSACESLKIIELPTTIETIGNGAFQGCNTLESADLGGKVKDLGAAAFSGCAKLRSVDLGDKLAEIKGGTFDHCLSLQSLDIPSSTLSIDEWSFYETTSLERYTVHEDNPNYCDVDGVLFNKLKTRLINFPSAYDSLEYTTPDGVSEIGEWAFACCQVPVVNLSYSLHFVGDYAFCDPRGTSKLYIYNKACQIFSYSSLDPNITIYSFDGSSAQTYAQNNGYSFEVIPDPEVMDYEYTAITEDGTLRITKYNGTAAEVEVPSTLDGVTVSCIGDAAFMGNATIKSLTLPQSVYKIQANAFRDCTALESVTAEGVTILRDNAFYNCPKLASTSFSKNLNYIGENVFRECGLTEFTWPAAVEKIERETFYGCTNLKSITIPEGVTTIGDRAFDSTALQSLSLPSTVTSVMNYAFFFCEALAEINLHDGIESIGVSAFQGTAHYNNPDNWEDGIYYLGKYALDYNYETLPTNAVIKSGTLLLGDNAFSYCSNLSTLYIPESVIHFGERIFYKSENVIINGVEGSAAETFATANGLQFSAVKLEHSHNWSDGIVTKEPTCLEAGIRTFTCACGDSYTVSIPVVPHTEELIPAIEATCTSFGVTAGSKCSVCGSFIDIPQGIPQKPHTPIPLKAKAATCTAVGLTEGSKCSVCDTILTAQKTVAKKDHSYKTTTTKATLKKNGKTISKCTVCGKTASTTTIYYAKTVKLKKATFTYTGKTIKPTLVIKTSKGKTISSKYYTVSGTKSTKKIGKFKITLKFKGNYSGTKTLYYTINPKTVASLKLKAGKKQMTVSYKKDSSVGGYEIMYATNKSFKKAKTTKATSAKKTIKKLTSKKTYYVKVRAYLKVSGKTYYGAYCKAKTVKVK